ncbi:hypothetical protein [Methylobacterium aquaticum]|jgi:hypothetical protein|uniref:DUF2946 domain-containing protein n=1 Tax=Methylobacterium aquaticum TaxID=270351 RepID=A0A0J6SDR7_9HYPH|nr:hypothetical protein [Methylobacterium aquaticum]KMO31799.1 hypothetical protein VP06_18830 [Methylobacterium aquaticum]
MSDLRHRRDGTARWRALAAVLSLYGLVFQVFLTGLDPVPAAAGAGILCPSHQGPAGSAPLGHAHACCTVACHGPLAPPAPAAADAWPPRAAIVLSWSVEAAAPGRKPPAGPASARGPPIA